MATFSVNDQVVKMDDVWPIENLWDIIRQELSKYQLDSSDDMKQKMIGTRENFSEEKCMKMIESIQKRVKAIARRRTQRITEFDYRYILKRSTSA